MTKKKNHIKMGIRGKQIDIQITATSEERAERMYEAIEKLMIKILRDDLDSEWEQDDEN